MTLWQKNKKNPNIFVRPKIKIEQNQENQNNLAKLLNAHPNQSQQEIQKIPGKMLEKNAFNFDVSGFSLQSINSEKKDENIAKNITQVNSSFFYFPKNFVKNHLKTIHLIYNNRLYKRNLNLFVLSLISVFCIFFGVAFFLFQNSDFAKANGGLISFVSSSSAVPEFTGRGGILVCQATTSPSTTTVNYAVTAGTPAATGGGNDYTLVNGTLTIPIGQTCGTIGYSVINNTVIEQSEQFVVTLSGATNSTLGSPSVHTVTILDDDQTKYYPGGVGSSSNLKFWGDASTGLTTDGIKVISWTDQSGNSNNAYQISPIYRPTLQSTALGGKPAVRFNGNDDHLMFSPALQSTASNYTVFSAMNANDATSTDQRILDGGAGTRLVLSGVTATSGKTGYYDGSWRDVANAATGSQLLTWNLSGTTGQMFRNGAIIGTQPYTQVPFSANSRLASADNGINNNFNGDIGEFLIYNTSLNSTQRTMVDNYLAHKYGFTISNKQFNLDSTYWNQLAGIGRDAAGTISTVNSGALTIADNGSTLGSNGEYVLAGNNGDTATTSTADLPAGVNSRWNRIWAIDKTTPNSINAKLTFDLSQYASGLPATAANYQLLYRSGTSGNFSVAMAATAIVNTDQIEFTVNDASLIDGYYTLGTASNTVSAISTPSAITNLSGTGSSSQVNLTWTAPADGGSPITDYVVQYSTDNFASNIQTFNDGVSTTNSTTVTGLIAGQMYQFRAFAVNIGGQSASSNLASVLSRLASPSITSITPNSGPTTGATATTLVGTNFAGSLKRDITITNTGSAQTNFQVQIKYNTKALIDAGKMKSDCSDARFVDTDGTTNLNYWIEMGCNTTETFFWVLVPSVPVGSKIITITYGDSTLSSASNLSAVFPPLAYTTNKVWLSAENTDAGYNNGANVNTWYNRVTGYNSGNAHPSIKPTVATNQINSRPVMRFSDTSGFYLGTIQVSTSGIRYFVVSKSAATTGSNWQRLISSTNGVSDDYSSITGWSQNRLTDNTGLPLVYGTTLNTGSYGSGKTIDNFMVGAGSPNMYSNFVGDIAEVIVFGADINSTDQTTIQNYLNQKYGLFANAPAAAVSGTETNKAIGIQFGGISGTSTVWNSATGINSTSPAHTVGAKNIIVTNRDGQTSTLINGFTYLAPAVTSISPASGPTEGGTTVTITGTSFVSGAVVKFGSVTALSTVFNSPTSLTAYAPAQAAGVVNVQVVNPDLVSGSLANAYTYTSPAISSLSSTSGSTVGGTTLTINGSGFEGSYRRAITITNPSSAKSNYSMNVTMNTKDLLDQQKMRTDCGDIRFKDISGNAIPYWLESGCNTTLTSFWLKIPTVAAGSNTIYVEYGTPSLTSQSDITVIPSILQSSSNRLWLKSSSFSGQTSGTPISTWQNVAPNYVNSFNAIQANSAQQANVQLSVINSYPVVRFDGADNYDVADIRTATGGMHAFVVSKSSEVSGSNWQKLFSGTAPGLNDNDPGGWSMLRAFDGSGAPLAYSTDIRQASSSSGKVLANLGVGYLRFSGGIQRFVGDVAEMLLFDAQLTSPDQTAVQTFLNQKYGLDNTLPTFAVSSTENKNTINLDFGGTSAVGTWVSPTQITATIPQHAAGAITLTVTNRGGLTATTTYTYQNPSITSISPNNGPTAGGTAITISGQYFYPVFRTPITISNSSSTLTDYQVLVTVNTQALISAGKMKNDCGDLRIRDTNDVTELGFWIESGCNTTTTRIWTKVPSLPTGNKTIYIRYGNPLLTSQSSASNTFVNNSIFQVFGDCLATDANCVHIDNHTEADAVRLSNSITSSSYTTTINDTAGAINFFRRYRFLFVPNQTYNYGIATNSDDGSEVGTFPLDGYGGGINTSHPFGAHTVLANWYGGHATGTCGTSGTPGTLSTTLGQGYWLDYIMNQGGGGMLAQMCLNDGGGYKTVSTTNFPNQLFARNYPASGTEPTTIIGAESAVGITIDGLPLNVTSVSSTQIQGTTPANTGGAKNVVITNWDGSSVTSTGGYIYGSIIQNSDIASVVCDTPKQVNQTANCVVSLVSPYNFNSFSGTINLRLGPTGSIFSCTLPISGTAANCSLPVGSTAGSFTVQYNTSGSGSTYLNGSALNVVSAAISLNGLNLYYDFSYSYTYNGVGQFSYDLSSNQNNATFGASLATESRDPSFVSSPTHSLSFDGNDQLASSLPSNFSANKSFEVWFKRANNTSNTIDQTLVSSRSSSDVNLAATVRNNTIQAESYSTNSSSTEVLNSQFIPNTDWQMASVTFNSSTNSRSVYVNGILIAQDTVNAQTASSLPLLIGSRLGDGLHEFVGNIAVVRVYSRVLSLSEIGQHFNGEKARFGFTNTDTFVDSPLSLSLNSSSVLSTNQSVSGIFLPIQFVDRRANFVPYSATVSLTNFQLQTKPSITIPASQVRFDPGFQQVSTGTGNFNTVSNPAFFSAANTPLSFYQNTASNGGGKFIHQPNLQVTIPAYSAAGTYKSVLTISVS